MRAEEITNIEDMREYMIYTLERLEKKAIDVTEAGIIAKGGETIMSSLKLQLSYSGMRGEVPNIPFLEECNTPEDRNLIEGEKIKSLPRSRE